VKNKLNCLTKFQVQLKTWAKNPLQNPNKVLECLSSNSFNYLLPEFANITCPIDYCKNTYLPNHLNWFLKQKGFIFQSQVVKRTSFCEDFFHNLIDSTTNLQEVENEIANLMNNHKLAMFISNKKLTKKSLDILKRVNRYEMIRVSYNSQIQNFITQKLQGYGFLGDKLDYILTPTFGTVYPFLAEEYIKTNKSSSTMAKKYFGNSVKDLNVKLKTITEFSDPILLSKRNKKLKEVKGYKQMLYRKHPELLWIDGLITFDNLVDKLIVYSGILRHSVFLKLALFIGSDLKDEEVFKLDITEVERHIIDKPVPKL